MVIDFAAVVVGIDVVVVFADVVVVVVGNDVVVTIVIFCSCIFFVMLLNHKIILLSHLISRLTVN